VLQTLPLTKAERAHRLEVLLDELDIAYVLIRRRISFQAASVEGPRSLDAW